MSCGCGNDVVTRASMGSILNLCSIILEFEKLDKVGHPLRSK